MAIISYMPEMGEKKPENVQGNVSLWGDHYYIETPLTLKGIGIKFDTVLEAKNLTPQGQYKAGWNVYRASTKAMDKLRNQYDFARESLLD